MKFILGKDCTLAFNSKFVKTIYIEQEAGEAVSVTAELIAHPSNERDTSYDYNATLATFDKGSLKENFSAAQAYLANLVKELNGGRND
ncbi:MAG: hypothetical protein IJK81_05480 [Selenomonadaceae bacterium]|nr:hypothetical protein [Selenomonadaceae bacterium]